MKENPLVIRKAALCDLAQIRFIFDRAKEYMIANGNLHQWVPGHPDCAMLTDDIANGQLYVLETDKPHAVFALIPGADPTYGYIDGAWLSDRPYAALHRVASDGVLSGVFRETVKFARTECPGLDLRVDTHRDNLPMQRAISKTASRTAA